MDQESENDFVEKSSSLEPALFKLDDYLKLEIPPKKKILNPWLSEQSIILISGWRGTGKTWFGLSLFLAIARGESFGPWNTETPVPCLYLDGEMSASDVQERLKLLIGENQPQLKSSFDVYSDSYANSIGIPRANLLKQKWREDLKKVVLQKGIKLLGLDNISSLTPGIDENLKKDWDSINQWLLELRFSGIASILLHHTGKGGDQRGTSAREDNIDTSIILHRPSDYRSEEGARFIVKFKKTRVKTKDLSLLTDYEFSLVEGDGLVKWTWNSAKKKNQIEILRMLDEKCPQNEIARILNIDKGHVSRIKKRAIKGGFLSDSGKLTPDGIKLVNPQDEDDPGDEF